jgi:hypothetical protein
MVTKIYRLATKPGPLTVSIGAPLNYLQVLEVPFQFGHLTHQQYSGVSLDQTLQIRH